MSRARWIVALLVSLVVGSLLSAGAAAAQDGGGTVTCASQGVDPLVPDAQVDCDLARGWRLSAWIGASGDGIVRVERAEPAWTTRFEGPYCAAGVAAASPADLVRLGMPNDLADQWGFPESACGGTDVLVLARTGRESTRLGWIALGLVIGGIAALLAAARLRPTTPSRPASRPGSHARP